jgi:hypothetical protein
MTFAETIAHSIANSGGQIALGHKANVLEYLTWWHCDHRTAIDGKISSDWVF